MLVRLDAGKIWRSVLQVTCGWN